MRTYDFSQINFKHICLVQDDLKKDRIIERLTKELQSVKRSKRTCKGWITKKTKKS